jgi:LmbE family N-acetylglucosaminyl deacetylase
MSTLPKRTLVAFHAHPDDEAIATGGVMAKAAAAGHRVVLVVATRGERGEVPDGYLNPGEELWERRVEETHAAAEILGVSRIEFLGYVDSGMMGEPTNDDPACFWQADVEEAASRLAAILTEERADVLTAYDENGVYGHPDHIQVHRVGVRAGAMAGTPKVYLQTINKDRVRRLMAEAIATGNDDIPGDIDPDFDMGVSEELITTAVDVSEFVDLKRKAMASHGSQISESSFFLAMPLDRFRVAFGQEDYILCGSPPGSAGTPGTLETDVFAGLSGPET